MTRGERVCAFIQRFCIIPDGAQVGKPIVLAEFQRKFILAVYDNPHGTRRGIAKDIENDNPLDDDLLAKPTLQ